MFEKCFCKGLDSIGAVLELMVNPFKFFSVTLDSGENIYIHYNLYKYSLFSYLLFPLYLINITTSLIDEWLVAT